MTTTTRNVTDDALNIRLCCYGISKPQSYESFCVPSTFFKGKENINGYYYMFAFTININSVAGMEINNLIVL